MNAAEPIVLVHGAWGSGAGWAALVPHLASAGREVRAIDLPGHGEDQTPPADVGIADYAERVVACLRETGPALLVGHSMGGMVISAAAEAAPHLVRKLVYVAALLPQDGQSLLDLIRLQKIEGIRAAVRPASVPGATVLAPDVAGDLLFHDVDARQREKALAQLGHQPNRGQTDAVRLSQERFGRIARAYVFCSEDRVVSPELQHKMVQATPCAQTFTLNCGHVPQLSCPEKLAGIMLGL